MSREDKLYMLFWLAVYVFGLFLSLSLPALEDQSIHTENANAWFEKFHNCMAKGASPQSVELYKTNRIEYSAEKIAAIECLEEMK